MPVALIAAGTGRYADPWHPFPATSRLIAESLRADGWLADADLDVDGALTRLEGVDLLVVNAAGSQPGDGPPEASRQGYADALARGIGVLAVHIGMGGLREYPGWRSLVGGEWKGGVSWHPDISDAEVRILDSDHPVTRGAGDFGLFDERYTDLVLDEGSRVLAAHELDDVLHPLVWVREGANRVVVSALGHDERSFDSAGHRALLARAARWAIGG